MDLKVDGGPLMSMVEVEWYQWTGIDIYGQADVNIDVSMSIHLYIPHSKVYDKQVTSESGWGYGQN